MTRAKKSHPRKKNHARIPDLVFGRIVRDIAHEFRDRVRFDSTAMKCLKESAEAYLINMFEDAGTYAIYRGHNVVSVHHLHIALQMVERKSNMANASSP